jgi:hypothetical protein
MALFFGLEELRRTIQRLISLELLEHAWPHDHAAER